MANGRYNSSSGGGMMTSRATNTRSTSRSTSTPRTSSRRNYSRSGGGNSYASANVSNNLTAMAGQYVNARTGRAYQGPMHMHNGRAMVGATHSSAAHDSLVRVNQPTRQTVPRRSLGNQYSRSSAVASTSNMNTTYSRRLQSAARFSPIAANRLHSRGGGNVSSHGSRANSGANHMQQRLNMLKSSYNTVNAPGTRLKK